MKIMTKGFLVVLGALIMGVLPGGAVELRLKWEPGKRYVFDNTADSSTKMPLPGQGLIETKGRMVMRVHNDVSPHEKGLRVSQAFDSIRMRQEMQGLVMEYDSSDPSKGGGLLGTVLKPMTETKFAAIYDKKGKVVGTEGLDEVQGADQLGMGKEELEAMARQSSEFLPGRDVKPGDTWKSEVDLPMGELGGKVTIDYTLKLENIVEQEGRKVARVSLSGKTKAAEEKEGEEVLKTEVKEATGMMLFDIELGQPVEISTTTLLETGLPAGIPQAEGAPGKMPIKSVSVQRLVGVEDLKEEASGSKGESKARVEPSAPAESKEEKRARRKARKAKRKAEKVQPE
ncbi:MAG: hypothetical protein MK194_03425 [Roseibacillus sp.]|nr:hypothetical protein [Roseibacillus sp.]